MKKLKVTSFEIIHFNFHHTGHKGGILVCEKVELTKRAQATT